MSKLFTRLAGFFSSRTFVGVDKVGNRYFTRKEEVDGIRKWVFDPSFALSEFFFHQLFLVLWIFACKIKIAVLQN